MKKARILVLFLAFVLVASVAIGCSQPAPTTPAAPTTVAPTQVAPQVIKLKYATFNPATAPPQLVDTWYFEELNKLIAPNKVEVEWHYGGSLGGREQLMDLVTSKAVDLVGESTAIYADRFPVGRLVGSTGIAGIGNWEKMALINDYWQLETKLVVDEAAAKGVKILRVGAAMPYFVQTTKAIKSMADLKGVKMRVMLADLIPLWEAMGMVPVSVSMTETYEALMRGTLNATPTDYMYAEVYKFTEVAKYIYEMEFPVHMVYLTMNQDSYQKLPDFVKTGMIKVTEAARDWSFNMLKAKETEAKAKAMAQGAIIVKTTPEEVALMKGALPAAKKAAIDLGVKQGAKASDIEAVFASADEIAKRLIGK